MIEKHIPEIINLKFVNSLLKRCTDSMLRVFAQAAQAAAKEGKEMIEPSHLFYGLTDPEKQRKRRVAKKSDDTIALGLSPQAVRLLADAASLAESYSHDAVGPEHLFVSILINRDPDIQKILKDHAVDARAIKRQLVGIVHHTSRMLDLLEVIERQSHQVNPGEEKGQAAPEALPSEHQHVHPPQVSALEFFTTELTNKDTAATIDPVIGREQEIERLIRILSRRTKNNPVLVGHPGVGKTAIIEGLAKRIVEGKVPSAMKEKRIFSLDLARLMAGSAMRGDLEFRLQVLINELKKDPSAILFIDELHNLVGSGSMHGSMDVGNILKPELARGDLRCIGATTFQEYKQSIEDDPALERRFQSIHVDEPGVEDTKKILQGLLSQYESFHGVTILPAALDSCVKLADRYLTEKYFPDKALDVIDEAAAKVKVEEHEGRTITPEIITDIISTMTGIPRIVLSQEDKTRVLELEETLATSILGQDEAVRTVARAMIRATSGLSRKGRPLASFLFLGPSGVGKTELARVLARELFGDHALLKFDMSEFSESHSIARLLGAPSGYVGYKEGGRLTEGVRRKPHSVILFDEAEKAHPRVLNVLLQILDDGRLTDMAGREVDFSNTVIILTSNVGTHHWQSKGGPLGFANADQSATPLQRERVLSDVKQWLIPELLNRIDHLLTFKPLLPEHLRGIANIHLEELKETLKEKNVGLRFTKTLLDAIMAQSKTDEHGARFIRHTIEDTVEQIIAQELLRRTSEKPITLSLRSGKNGLSCVVV